MRLHVKEFECKLHFQIAHLCEIYSKTHTKQLLRITPKLGNYRKIYFDEKSGFVKERKEEERERER